MNNQIFKFFFLIFMPIDQALLRQQNIKSQKEEQAAAVKLRQAKREDKSQLPTEAAPDDYRATRHLALIASLKSEKKSKQTAKDQLSEIAAMPAQQGANRALKFSWLNLIDSFGLTLIYINIHVFLHHIFPSMFCRLGREWLPESMSLAGAKSREFASRSFGLIETMVLLFLDLMVLMMLIGFVVLLLLIIEGAKKFFGYIDIFNVIFPF